MSIAAFLAVLLTTPQETLLEKAWEVEFDQFVLGTPLVQENLAIAGSRTGLIKAINIETGGAPAWEFQGDAGPVTRMAIQRNLLFVPAGSRSVILESVSGKVRKKNAFLAGRIVPGESRLYLTSGYSFDGMSYLLSGTDDVACFDPLAAKETWKANCSPRKVSSVVEGGGRVFLTGEDQIEAIDYRNGKRVGLAERASKGWPLHGLVIGQKLIYVQGGAKEVVCYDAKTLKELWTWEGRKRPDAGFIPPLIVGDKLILFPLPEVVCLDTKNGKDVWSLALEGPAEYSESPPAVRGKEVTVGVNGKVMSFDVAGKATWTFEGAKSETNPRAHQPVWAGDRLLYAVGTKLYCFKPRESPVTK